MVKDTREVQHILYIFDKFIVTVLKVQSARLIQFRMRLYKRLPANAALPLVPIQALVFLHLMFLSGTGQPLLSVDNVWQLTDSEGLWW